MASRPASTDHPNSFGARDTLTVGGRDYEIFNLSTPALAEHDIARLPYSIKVLLENLLRHEDSPHVAADDIVAVASWGANPEGHGQGAGDAAHEIALTPERVLMQDFTGVPGVVDLAAMATMGPCNGRSPSEPSKLASPWVNTPPSALTSQ